MFQSAKCSSRNLLLGFLVPAVAFFFCWQLIGLYRPAELVENGRLIVQSLSDESATHWKRTCVPFLPCNQTNGATSSTESIDAFQWCSADSSARGGHQKVITYTLFGAAKENVPVSHRYDSLLRNISTTAKELYPGWIVTGPPSRDTDSVIWRREVDAVDEWLRSTYTFHLMRDHRLHNHLILAGMWGAKVHQRRDLIQGLMRALVVAGQGDHKSTDQNSLNSILWPTAQYDVMAHDSYQCRNKQIMTQSPLKVYPFPTMRNGSYYVGGIGEKLSPDECPLACRPPRHKDWTFC